MKIGIAGLGFMGATHITAISKLQNVTVAAVSGTNPKTLSGDFSEVGGNLGRETGKFDFSHVNKHAEWQKLVEDPAIDAVDVCLPTDLHVPLTLAALANGKHVLCEKPMALKGADCDRMIEAAKQAGRTLMIGQVLRFWPEYLVLRDFVTSGKYGKVKSAMFVRRCDVPNWSKWLLDTERSGGALIDLLVHDIDQAISLFGIPPKVAAKSLGSVDTVSASFLYPGGPEVRVQGGWFEPGTPFSMSFQVIAEGAQLELSAGKLQLNDASGNVIEPELPTEDAYESQIQYFVDCCNSGKHPDRCPPEESAAAVKVANAMEKSRAADGEQILCQQ